MESAEGGTEASVEARVASPAGKVHRYLPHAENTKLSAKDVGSRLENHLVPRFGRLVMGDITTQQVQQFLVGAVKGGLSPATANRTPRRRTSFSCYC